ncbi:MAG: ABC transporter ATP-binding protein [Bacteroidales bacterium]
MIQAQNIHKSYAEVEVLKGIELEIKEGEIATITGASGAGKTTLLQIIGSLETPDKGRILIKNKDIQSLSAKKIAKFRNQEIGFIFQFHYLLPEFTALENVMMPALIASTPTLQAHDRASELLDFLGLSERTNHKPSELSGGEQQRVAVARALMNKPSIILADEPSGNLDTANAIALHELFFKLRDEFHQTFLIVTHNENLAALSDHKIVMKDGKIL